MRPSYRKIDYRVRPAKSIERKMLVESFRRLCEFGQLCAYRYVGFGSLYFSDFMLFHKALGFDSMVSIENTTDRQNQERFRMNVPFGNIALEFGHSNGVLQKLDWAVRTVAWLDYDKALSKECLVDVAYLAQHACAGSVIVVSVNAGNLESATKEELATDDAMGQPPTLVELLKKAVGEDEVPVEVRASDLSGWGVAKVFRQIVDTKIADALRVRNERLPAGARIRYRQLYNFHYQDDARMLTVGGVLYDEGQDSLLARCAFQQLDFIRDGEDAYRIETALLTHKEMRQIDAERSLRRTGLPLPASDIEKYDRTYRYYPTFVEAEIG